MPQCVAPIQVSAEEASTLMRTQVLEQSESKKEAGYMIVMGANAMRVINKIGISPSELPLMRVYRGSLVGAWVLIAMRRP